MQRTSSSALGFGAEVKSKQDNKINEALHQVEPEDLVKFGIIPELVGRLPVIAVLDDLDEDALVKILSEPKNAILKQYSYMFSLDGIELEITDDAMRAIAKKRLKENRRKRPAYSSRGGTLRYYVQCTERRYHIKGDPHRRMCHRR